MLGKFRAYINSVCQALSFAEDLGTRLGASKLGAAAVAGCFLTKQHHPRAAETNTCCTATRYHRQEQSAC